MAQPSEIISKLDRRRLAADLGITDHAISMALSRPTLPARWFAVVQHHCREAGLDCPPAVFGMRAVPQQGDAA